MVLPQLFNGSLLGLLLGGTGSQRWVIWCRPGSIYILTLVTVAQTIISQAIVGYRTWKISGKSSSVKTILLVFGLVVVIVESYANLHSRIPVQQSGK